jgi:hypothetical protein
MAQLAQEAWDEDSQKHGFCVKERQEQMVLGWLCCPTQSGKSYTTLLLFV